MILVAGGTGFIGSNIVRKLAPRGEKIRILTRNAGKVEERFPEMDVEGFEGDVRDPKSLHGAADGAQAVVHCVQFPNHPVENPRKGWTYLEVDRDGTLHMVEEARRAGVKQFLYLSGAGTGPDRKEAWFRAKHEAEEGIRQSGLPYTIFRPSWVYGPQDRSLNKFYAMSRFLPFVPVIGDGTQKIRPVFVKDLGEIVARSVGNDAAKGRVIEIGGPGELTMDEICRTMLKVSGRKRFLLHHPVGFMKFAAFFLQFMPGRPLSPDAVDFITMEEPVDLCALRELYPDLEMTSLEKALKTYLS